MKQLQIDIKKMPLGKLSKAQIQKGYKVCFVSSLQEIVMMKREREEMY
jgi:hypothetical protein